MSDLENRKKKIVGEPDEGEPHVRFDVAGDGQPGYGNGTEALSEEMERNGSALPKSQAPSPDPTIVRHMDLGTIRYAGSLGQMAL